MNATTQLATLKPQSEQTPKHKDPKRYLWLLSPALPLIGFAAATGYALAPKKLRAIAALGPVMLHGVIPLIDKMVGADAENHPEEAIKQLEQDPYYMRIVKAYIPLQYLTTIVGAYAASRKGTPFIDQIVLGMSVGAVNGIALNTAHELSHKSEKPITIYLTWHCCQRVIFISVLNTHTVIINVLLPLKTQHPHKWVRLSGNFGHVPSSVALNPPLRSKKHV